MSDSEKHAAGHVWRHCHALALSRTHGDTYSQAYNEAGVHIGAPVYRQGEGSHTYLTDLAYLLQLLLSEPVLTNDHLFDRFTSSQPLTLAVMQSYLSSDRGRWVLLWLWLAEGIGGALCSARRRTQKIVALQGAESRSAPSSVSPADDERDLGHKFKKWLASAANGSIFYTV